MRLREDQRRLVKQLAGELVGADARVLLFGSRTDDALRGGDIDLLVESPRPLPARFETEIQLGARIERALGGQRVDLLLVDPLTPLQPVHRAAQATGLVL
jgi:predicted nucleotidyltransferase